MKRADAITEIKDNWRIILPQMTGEAKRRVNGETSYICPLPGCHHGEHGDGLTYDPNSKDRNGLKCFGCGFSGSVIDLYMQVHNIADFNQATDDLAALLNIEIDNNQTAAEKPHNNNITEMQKQPADYTEYYRKCAAWLIDPAIGQAAREYINNRGISTKTATALNIGFDPAADPANAPGLASGKIYPTPRVIAPCNKEFYIARAIDPNAAYKAPNPKGSSADIFNADALYNGDIVFIIEGLFDALSFIEAGHQAIALNSVGNGDKLIKRLEEKPTAASFIICPDNEPNAETDKRTKAQMQELKEQLTGMGYKAIIKNIAGKEKDVNDAFIKDPAGFSERTAAAIAEVDDLAAFLGKVQTETYRPHATGVNFLDALLNGGVESQTLNLIAAAPATGKTALCSQIAEAIARNGKQVIYFNFEMSREQMLSRVISARLFKNKGYRMTSKQIRQGYKWNDQERALIAAEVEAYRKENRPRYIDANEITPELNNIVEYLENIGKRAEATETDAPAVFLDYLHLINSKGNDLQETIKETCIALKAYAVKYNTFVFAILAVNRDAMKDGRITLYSGRDSSNIEYSADTFISLNYKDIDAGNIKTNDMEAIESYRKYNRKWEMILRSLKDRSDGQAAAQTVLFDPAYMTFYATENAEQVTTQPGNNDIMYI